MNMTSKECGLPGYLREKKDIIDEILIRKLQHFRQHHVVTHLFDAMQYSVDAGGKRIRPILCLAACETVGGRLEEAIDAACALEFVHTYSLIHDDLPAMDDDDFRRGKPTCHKVFGEAAAILAGDALLTAAFEVLADRSSTCDDPNRYLHIIKILARAAGSSGMVQGQMLDLLFEGKRVSWTEAQHMHNLKTGALITASVEIGALLGHGKPEAVSALSSFGQYIGLAFQLADDILNVEGDMDVLGKPVGSDDAVQKASAPAILGLKPAKAYATQLVDKAVHALKILGERSEILAALARYVIEREK